MHNCKNLYTAWYLLYITYGVLAIAAGADKFFDMLVYWPIYLNPKIPALFNMSAQQFMYGVGIIEILAGLLVFARPFYGGLLIAAWFGLIILNLLSTGQYFDIAVRDVGLVVGALVLSLLTLELAHREHDLSRR